MDETGVDKTPMTDDAIAEAPPSGSGDVFGDCSESGPRRRAAFIFIACLLIAIIAALTAKAMHAKQQNKPIVPIGESAQSTYLDALAETNPGKRLARLVDVRETYPGTRQAQYARTQESVLKSHEEIAWAKVTEHMYDLEAKEGDKLNALAAYKRDWTTLFRTEQLKAYENVKPAADPKAVPYKSEPSKFAQNNQGNGLVGEPYTRPAPPKRRTTTRPRQSKNSRRGASSAVRIRRTSKPVYPSRAKRRGVEAVVTVSIDVNERGRASNVRVISVDADRYKRDFIRAAKRAARRTRFHPRKINGKAVPSRGFVRRYRFSLRD